MQNSLILAINFTKKEHQWECFLVSFAKYLGAPLIQNISERLSLV